MPSAAFSKSTLSFIASVKILCLTLPMAKARGFLVR
jgi:hypothetical protein